MEKSTSEQLWQERNMMSSREEIEATAKKIALLLAESKANFADVPMIFHQAKSYLSVSLNGPSSSDSGV